MNARVLCGDRQIAATLPERTRVIRAPDPLPALPDPARTLREVLASPIGMEPLARLVGPKARVTIAFDDPAKPLYPTKGGDFRALAIPVILDELERAGVERHRVRLLCANALHRQWAPSELARILGPRLVRAFGTRRLRCHDAEDPAGVVPLGETARGMEVEVNRAVVESDLLVYVGVPATPFNGGWKSVAVGLSTWRSIRHHHRPYREARGISTQDHQRSSFHKLMREMGNVIEGALAPHGTRVFLVEGIVSSAMPPELCGVVAGEIEEAHRAALVLLDRQFALPVTGQADVVLYGLPNNDYYSRYSVFNPILLRNLALSYAAGSYQGMPLARQGGIAIFVNPCRRQWSAQNHPSYIELFDRVLPRTPDPFDVWDKHAEEFAARPEYVERYRTGYGFHGSHPLILYGQGAYQLRHLSRVFLAGAEEPEVARRLGFEPFPSVEEAIAEAERTLGADCSITYQVLPPFFWPRVSPAAGGAGEEPEARPIA
jgi:hypothetical protein